MNPQLSINELLAALDARPEAVVARMTFQQQLGLLQRLVLGEAQVAEDMGAALLDALRLSTAEVLKAVRQVEEQRRRNREGLAAWERLQELDAKLNPLVEQLTAKAVEVFGEDWEGVRPIPFSIHWSSDFIEVNAPILQPLAAEVAEALQGRAALARVARRVEEQLELRDLLALASRRRELAEEAARRSA